MSKFFRKEEDLKMEVEIIKCFKSLLNNRWGAREALANPQCIYNLTFSITSPPYQTRKLICEVLTFLCWCEVPIGHSLVLKGMDMLREHRRDFGRFDAWLRLLEHTLDGRGKMGSMVGASLEYKQMAAAGTADNHLMEYTVRFGSFEIICRNLVHEI
ncbi:armadillo-type protein [Endogone sp. FLAS-F59071]|nr:armadillo-type protein [Endogone sp. FLAS-F59071]|eukprot:RUS13391.1 armadillo-type protein [Endogone sp. FLAS-F59071]